MTALSLYTSDVTSSTLPGAKKLVTVNTATTTTANNVTVGTATGWGEVPVSNNFSGWPSATGPSAPGGNGMLYDSTALEGQQIAAGTWGQTLRMKCGTGTGVVGDLLTRWFVAHADGTYTAIGSTTLTGQTINSTWTTYTLPSVTLAAVSLATGDKLYYDVWLNITSNGTGNNTAQVNWGDFGTAPANTGGAGNATTTPGYGPAPAPPLTPTVKSQPQYTIRLRDATLTPVGALSAWTGADFVLRMNDVGKWALTVRADDPLMSAFVRGAGIIVTRDRGDGTGAQTILSGPIWSIERKGKENFYVLAGPTDDWWLKARRAYPQGGRPYMDVALMPAPLRYLRLGEASGTSALDSSGNGQNGTYVNGPTLGVAGSIPGDPDTAITCNGASSQRVSVPNTGLPTGNAAMSVKVAFKIAGNPASSAVLWGYGDSGTAHKALNLYVDTAGKLTVDIGGGGTFIKSAAGVSLNTWHLGVATWDGTTLQLWLDNVSAGTATPGAQSIAAGPGINLGSTGNVVGSYFTGQLDEASLYGVALTSAQVAADYSAWSRTHGAYDTRTGVASTVIQAYVSANLVTAADTDRILTALTLAADPAVGTSVTGNARYDELLALLQQLASAGGDIGFKVVQTANGVLTFSCYQPSDRTANAKFSTDLKDLFDYSYSLAGPQANSVVVLGGGAAAARTALHSLDSASLGNWGLVEGMIDARDTSDTATMQQRGQAEIAAQAEVTNLALTPRDTDAIQYGRDYNLGDIVAITIDGNTITNKVRSVHIQLGGAEQELVTPGIGNPSQGEVAHWFDASFTRQQALRLVQGKLNRLSTSV